MKALLDYRQAVALAITAFAFTQPAAGQGITTKEDAAAVCGGTGSVAAKAIMNRWKITGDDGLTPLVRANNPLPADLEFLETWLEYPRAEERLKAVQAGMASIEAMEEAMRAINRSRRVESALQGARGRSGLTSGEIAPCNCNAALQGQLAINVTQFNNLKRQLDEANTRAWKQACDDYTIAASNAADQDVAAADATMTRTGAEWPKSDGQWEVNDQRIATVEKTTHRGTFTWTAIPRVIGKDGFTVRISADAFAQNLFDTGIGAYSPEGLILMEGKVVTKRVEVHVTPQAGQTLKGSAEFTVKPPPNARPGDEYTLRVGSFWGPEVKYTFRVPQTPSTNNPLRPLPPQ